MWYKTLRMQPPQMRRFSGRQPKSYLFVVLTHLAFFKKKIYCMQVCKLSMLLLKGSSKSGRVGLSDLREVAVHGATFG